MEINNPTILMIIIILFELMLAVILVLQIQVYSKIKEIDRRQMTYFKELEAYKDRLVEIRAEIYTRTNISLEIVSEIRTLLFSFQNKCEGALRKSDQAHLSATMELFEHAIAAHNNKDDNKVYPLNINREQLCAELDYFIARFDHTRSFSTEWQVRGSRPAI